jgi:uncharacterized protein (DUF1778 family)
MKEKREIKVLLSDKQHADVRLAAAIQGVPMARFARETVLAQATGIVEEAGLSGRNGSPRSRRKQRAS